LDGQMRSLGEQEAGRVALLPEQSAGSRAGRCGEGQQRMLQQPAQELPQFAPTGAAAADRT